MIKDKFMDIGNGENEVLSELDLNQMNNEL